MEIIKHPTKDNWKTILKRPEQNSQKLEGIVRPILDAIKNRGDKALIDLNIQFEGYAGKELIVSQEEIDQAENELSEELKNAILMAKNHIAAFHGAQKEKDLVIETMPGVECRRKSVAIERVGLYIPGGTAPLFSTVLMLGVPAQIAGCKEIVLCTPPGSEGEIHPAILYSAKLVGVNTVVRAGGSQAIGAMAYGTESVPQVYKIFGPGNQYVTTAKKMVTSDGIAIDMPAGPSEVAVLADESAIPEFVAADLLSQAEHGVDSQVILISTSDEMVQKVSENLNLQLQNLPRKSLAEKSLNYSKAILVNSIDEAVEMLNEYGPEHLILAVEQDEVVADQIVNAGSVFLGNYSPESVGDYASGTNHTLPTNGAAKSYSGVSLDSFVKKITYQKLSEQGLLNIGKAVELMAEAEELQAHKEAVSVRLNFLKNK